MQRQFITRRRVERERRNPVLDLTLSLERTHRCPPGNALSGSTFCTSTQNFARGPTAEQRPCNPRAAARHRVDVTAVILGELNRDPDSEHKAPRRADFPSRRPRPEVSTLAETTGGLDGSRSLDDRL